MVRQIKEAAFKEGTPYVIPHHFECTMTLSAHANIVPAGEMVRAWMPIPRAYPFQTDFKLITNSCPITLAPETSPIRSAYMEQKAASKGPTTFDIKFSYTERAIFFDLKPEKVTAPDLKDPVLAKYAAEAPHVVFTDKIKSLGKQIVGSETNPMLKAKAIFDWIGSNIQYSFAREYSTLTNISDYCLSNRYGDCGQEALLFITLCRSQGVPARWQTGWDIFPGGHDIHDWTEIYLAPYGWVPVDPWAGIHATQYCPSLTEAERKEVHDFYFGGLEGYRMAANSDHSIELTPAKLNMRSDNVDFQRGEMEWAGGNLYFSEFTSRRNVVEQK